METDDDDFVAYNVFFNSQNVLKQVWHPVNSLHEQDMEKRVRVRVMGSAGRNEWWISESGDFPKSSDGLIQVCLDRTATSLTFNAPIAHPAHLV